MSPRIKIDEFLSSEIYELAKHNILSLSNWITTTNDICEPRSIDKEFLKVRNFRRNCLRRAGNEIFSPNFLYQLKLSREVSLMVSPQKTIVSVSQ